MNTSRRRLLLGSLGAAQLALLDRFAVRPAHAGPTPAGGPTKLVCIWLDGGCSWEHLFAPFTKAGIEKFIPGPDGGIYPFGYSPAMVRNFDGTAADLADPGTTRKLRGPVFWNDQDPGDASGPNALSGGAQVYRPWGYSWADPTYGLFNRTCVLVGANQGTASHASGRVASLCGIAGATFRAPSVQAVVANHLSALFPDRPIPSANLAGPAPLSLNLPVAFSPYDLASLAMVESTISDRRDAAWNGLRGRTDTPAVAFDGTPGAGTVPLSIIDQAVLEATRARRGRSTTGTDALYQQLHDNTVNVSKTIARDVLDILGKTKGFEHLALDPFYGGGVMVTACTGSADACGPVLSGGPYDFALRLLKSDLVTSVTMRATSIRNGSFDMHSSNGARLQTSHLRIAFEGIGQFLNEMQLTPAPSGKGSLLDETLVYICSDFGRTFAPDGSYGVDHHPATCALLVGGGIKGNQMLGGYDEAASGSPLGAPVSLLEESGEHVVRVPNSQDVAATVLGAFGLRPGKDFFIPGGYGFFDGAFAT